MMAITISALLLLGPGIEPVPPVPRIPDEIPLRMVQSDDGVMLRLVITPEQVKRIPSWDPETGQPAPLPMKLAIELARDSVRAQYSQFDKLEIEAIEIGRVGWGTDDRWFYVVRFHPTLDGQQVHVLGAMALVLMDGTVVAPERSVRADRN